MDMMCVCTPIMHTYGLLEQLMTLTDRLSEGNRNSAGGEMREKRTADTGKTQTANDWLKAKVID